MLNMPGLVELKHTQSLERNEKKRQEPVGGWGLRGAEPSSSSPQYLHYLTHSHLVGLSQATNAYAIPHMVLGWSQAQTNPSHWMPVKEGTGIRWNNMIPDWHSYRFREECAHQLFYIQPTSSSIHSQNCHDRCADMKVCLCILTLPVHILRTSRRHDFLSLLMLRSSHLILCPCGFCC